MSRIAILGCGPVGKHIAIDLCRDPDDEVISVDINREVLDHLTKEHPVQTRV
jgi:saccharopine dehydrogenase-like NADP-dependent oxidoreductase